MVTPTGRFEDNAALAVLVKAGRKIICSMSFQVLVGISTL